MLRLKEENFSECKPPLVGWVMLAACLAVLCGGPAWALGTSAGTVIANTATVAYTVGGNPTAQSVSAANTFRVLEVIDAAIAWQDGGAVAVRSPQGNGTLTFLLTNTGNGSEAFALTAVDALSGDGFDPEAQAFWIESNGTTGLQTTGATPDTLYQAGLNDPNLAADAGAVIYLLSNIPAGVADTALGRVQVVAAATTPGAAGAAAGTELIGAGAGGVNAVVGASNADTETTATYVVASVTVNVTKSIVRIVDRFGGSQPFPGARVTYRLTVATTGSGTAEALVVTDTIPADMAYVPNSMRLDGAAQSDTVDAPSDPSDFNVTSANTVTVTIGDTVAPATHTIDFITTIN